MGNAMFHAKPPSRHAAAMTAGGGDDDTILPVRSPPPRRNLTATAPATSASADGHPNDPHPGLQNFTAFAFFALSFGFVFFTGFFLPPAVAVASFSAAGNATAGAPAFDVALQIYPKMPHLLRYLYNHGSVRVSCAGGAIAGAATALPDLELGLHGRAVRWRAALPEEASARLADELRGGAARLDVAVAYTYPSGQREFRWYCGVNLHAPAGKFRASCTYNLLGHGLVR